MVFRIPRGYDTNRTSYQELSEGVRPEASAVPMEAWTGLAAVRVDELAHDPIVLDAGTVVGIASGGDAAGKIFPCHNLSGTTEIDMVHHSDGVSWGLPITTVVADVNQLTDGPVKPLGVVFAPTYSFILQDKFTNYKRNENVGIVTNYLIQVPARTIAERAIITGDRVMIASQSDMANGASNDEHGKVEYGQITNGAPTLGTLAKWDGTTATEDFVIGRCFRSFVFATGSNDVTYRDDISNISLTDAGAAEFKALARVQTVPGLTLSGSGTAGAPGWLLTSVSDGSGNFSVLTILVRL